jgi:hypothetical protein
MQHDTSPSHRVDQAVDWGLWNVVPLHSNGCAKVAGYWQELDHSVLNINPEHPKHAQCLLNMQTMEELGHLHFLGIVYRSL